VRHGKRSELSVRDAGLLQLVDASPAFVAELVPQRHNVIEQAAAGFELQPIQHVDGLIKRLVHGWTLCNGLAMTLSAVLARYAERSTCVAASRRGGAPAIASPPASRRVRRCATGTGGSNPSCRVAGTRSPKRGKHTLQCARTHAPEAGRLQYRQGKSRHLDVLGSNPLDHGQSLASGRRHRLARRTFPVGRHQALTPTRMMMLLPCTVQEERANGRPGI
jgi:hypothetical protein